ncbi:MAG: TM1802 family CRISPR-associated protein [Caldicoprobacterales bacterium]|jgi:CRISPR-associated protein Csh1
MGFLQAVYSLGLMASEAYKDSTLADIINFLQLPYPLSEEEKDKVYAIRVWLDAADNYYKDVLDIKGVANVDRIEYKAIGGEEVKEVNIKEHCLYREPVGRNVSWRFTPLYKLGRGSNNSHKDLVGKNGYWQGDDKCRFYKLYHNLLIDYEKAGYFTEGSVDRIMADLVAQIDKIAAYWSERRIPCFLIFGLKATDNFLYPGEIPVFINYFREKLALNTLDNASDKKTKHIRCGLCSKTMKEVVTLDKVFKFATFDKPGFLPGTTRATEIKEKVFPVCKTCYETLSAGKEEMENRFANFNTIPNINLYVIPEIISDRQEFFRRAAEHTKNFLKNGVRYERQLFNHLLKQNEGIVFHFMFAEINQAQLIIHSLVEDVPPTRLRQLQDMWIETCQAYSFDNDVSDKKCSLDTAISQITAVLISLAGINEQEKDDQEKKKAEMIVMKEKTIYVISRLLNGESVSVNEIKKLMVSRFSRLFNDPNWLNPYGKEEMSGQQKVKGMAEVIDFLYRANRR